MQRSTATFLLFVVILGAAIVVASRQWSGEPEPPRGPDPALTAPSVQEPHPGHPAEPPPAPAGLQVSVQVELRERFVAPSPERVEATDGLRRALPVVLVAGTGASFDNGPQRPGVALVAIGIEGGGSVLRTVALPEVGVARAVVGARIVVRGVVRDAQRRPLPGATVWLGERDASGAHRDVATGDDGAFEIAAPAGIGVPFVVRASGCATSWQPVEIAAPSPQLGVTLAPAAPLVVQIATSSERIPEARAFVLPRGAVSTELAQYPFFLQALSDGIAIDANGTFAVHDLPMHGEVGIVVRHARVPAGAAHLVALAKAGVRAVVALGKSAPVFAGRVVDERGQPLAGVSIWTRPADRELGGNGLLRLVPPHVDLPGTCFARSDGNGAFVVGGGDARSVTLSLRAPGRAGRDLAWPRADDAPIELPEWKGGEPSFRLSPPRAASVWTAEVNLAGGVREALAADTPWVVSFPCAGRFEVVMTTRLDGVEVGMTRSDVSVTGPVDLSSPRAP